MKQIIVEMYFLSEKPQIPFQSVKEHLWRKTLLEAFPEKDFIAQSLKGLIGGPSFLEEILRPLPQNRAMHVCTQTPDFIYT